MVKGVGALRSFPIELVTSLASVKRLLLTDWGTVARRCTSAISAFGRRPVRRRQVRTMLSLRADHYYSYQNTRSVSWGDSWRIELMLMA